MSAGLIMAALEYQGIELQLVTGSRADLIKVHDGSQYAAFANIEQIRFERQIAPYRQAWSRYAYSEAEAGLKAIKAPNNSHLQGQFTRFRDLSRAFAEWDNFNHLTAVNLLRNYAPSLPETLKVYLSIAMRLQDNNPDKREAAQLLDLYLNAQRRAAQGRYDDAIARVYRLIEWTAQWILKTQCNLNTADIDEIRDPRRFDTQPKSGWAMASRLICSLAIGRTQNLGPGSTFYRKRKKQLAQPPQNPQFFHPGAWLRAG